MIVLKYHPHGNCFFGLWPVCGYQCLGDQRCQAKCWWWGLVFRGSHLQRPQAGKSQHMMGWGQNRVHSANPSEPNLWELKVTACAVPSLSCLCDGLPETAHDSPFLPFTRLAAITTRGAWICCWHCPCDRTLKMCVFVCTRECM